MSETPDFREALKAVADLMDQIAKDEREAVLIVRRHWLAMLMERRATKPGPTLLDKLILRLSRQVGEPIPPNLDRRRELTRERVRRHRAKQRETEP